MNNKQPDKYYSVELVLVVDADVVAPDKNSALGQVKQVVYKAFPASDGLNLTVRLSELKPLKVAEHIIPRYQPGWMVKLFSDIPDVATKDGNRILTVPAGAVGIIRAVRESIVNPVTVEWFNIDCETECDYPEFELFGETPNAVASND